jgi:hypothetical protein
MYSKNLFDTALINPAIAGADELMVITGYSSPSIVNRQFEALEKRGLNIKVRILVGMASLEGIDSNSHLGFIRLSNNASRNFSCRYLLSTSITHSKNYLWLKKGKPVVGFTGSANYSINAFSGNVIESLTPDNPKHIKELFEILSKESVDCTDLRVTKLFNIFKTPTRAPLNYRTSDEEIPSPKKIAFQSTGLPCQNLSLLARNGEVHQRGGINWQLNRKDKNAAYIPVPASVARSGFFPVPGEFFKVICDDGSTLLMATEGAGGKQITTPESNQILGHYLRSRLGVKSGAEVTLNDFKKYGRSDVTFYKKSAKLFYMDFSV